MTALAAVIHDPYFRFWPMPADWECMAGYLGKWRARSPSN